MELDEFQMTCEVKKHDNHKTHAITVASSQYSEVLDSTLNKCQYNYQRNIPSLQDSHSCTNTPQSSPKRRLKLPSKRFQIIWSTIKNLSPVHRLKHSSKNRSLIKNRERCSSHPDISYNNLVVLTQIDTKRSQDDSDALCMARNDKFRQPITSFFIDDIITQNTEIKDSICHTSSLEKLDDSEIALTRHRITALRQHPFYHLEVHLRYAKNLMAKDSCGTSDPYVKFKIGNRVVYKSRTVSKCLDPIWDEYFIIAVEDVFQPILVKVYDYDFGFQDDYLGAASIYLTKLDIASTKDLKLFLTENGSEDNVEDQSWGYICLTVTLVPKTQEEKEQHFGKGLKTVSSGSTGMDTSAKKLKFQLWDSVVNIVLVEGKNFILKDENLTDIYVKFKLGSEKFKSKMVGKCVNPVWCEQFDLHTYQDQSKVLEIIVCTKEIILGKCTINLNDLKHEQTNRICKNIEDINGYLLLLVTVSATLGVDTASDLNHSDMSNKMFKNYDFFKSFQDIDDIGYLYVKVFKAEGLAAADLGGKSDPFCVIELVNARLQTPTEYKTLSPEWNKIYAFQIKDIHSILEITVYDEDRDKKVEFLGKVAIPLLKVKNGVKKWYTLKDKKLLNKSKGYILLELNISFNTIKASIRTFNPKETKYIQIDQRFKRTIFVRNVYRLKTLIMEIYDILKYMNSCFQWDSVSRSIISLIIFLLGTYFFELYMAPIILLLLFIKIYIWISVESYFNLTNKDEEFNDLDDSFDEEDDENKNEEKKSLKEKLQTVQEITAIIQNVIGGIASYGERVKNTFNFSVPFLSWLAIICLSFATLILYYIPLRYLIMIWGINKFTKKLRSPDAISNNELIDFLSRVPDNDEKLMYREYKAQPTDISIISDADRKKKKKIV